MDGLCRTCLNETFNTNSINILSKLIEEQKTILDCIIQFSNIQVLDADPLPKNICNQCYIKLQEFYVFRDIIVTSDKQLKEKFNNFVEVSTQTILRNQEGDTDDKGDIYSEDGEDDIYSDNFQETEQDTDLFENEDTESLINKSNIKNDPKKNDSFGITTNYNLRTNNNTEDYQDCSHNIKTKGSITREKLKRSKAKKSKVKKIHECKECQKVFKKADHLNVHITYKHLEKQFRCEVCEKKFARKYDLAYHSRVHTGERPFTCEMCGKSFASSSYFYMHKRIHTGLKKMKCENCQNTFNNSDQLQIHIRQKHTGEKPFLCEMCSHAFTSSSALYRHKRDVHDQKVECPVCSKLYSSRVLKDHIKRHQERDEGIKRFSCDLCGKRFTCATSRKRHLVVHSGEKAFKCEVCEKSFNQRSTLQTHMRIHSQVMPYQCEICSKTFRYKHHLKIHCEKHHKNECCSIDDTQHYDNILIKTE